MIAQDPVRPPICYFGGKTTLAATIAGLFPPHRHYVEVFGGSLAVLLAKQRVDHETVNDLDRALMTFWQIVRDRPAEFERVCALTPHSRAEHQAAYEPTDDPLETARRVWVQLTQGRAGARRRTGWRHYEAPAGTHSMPAYLTGYAQRIAPAADRLAGVSLECQPALDLIAKYGRQPDVLIYADPPYVGSTRSRSWDGYLHEMRDEHAHADLADALAGCAAAVVLSGYASPLYERLYAGWHRHEMLASTGQGGGWGNRVEVLWSNRAFTADPGLFELGGDA